MTLAELLATILIMSFVMISVASGVAASQRVYKQVQEKADAQTLLSTTINAMAGQLYNSYVWTYSTTTAEDSVQVSESDAKGIYYTQSSTRPTSVRYTEPKESVTVDVIFSEESGYIHFGNAEVTTSTLSSSSSSTTSTTTSSTSTAYYPVVSDKTSTLDLYTVLKDNQITYQNGVYSFTVQVYLDNGDNTDDTLLEEQDAQIRSAIVLN